MLRVISQSVCKCKCILFNGIKYDLSHPALRSLAVKYDPDSEKT
jgi:hypothetical protein